MSEASRSLEALLGLMRRLRDPQRGCEWDRAQDFASIAPYTIEEAYEVADAIARNDPAALRDELGDLLFQVVFHARMAEERGWFDFASVASGIHDKLVRRHPHVFAPHTETSGETLSQSWERHKATERAARGESGVLAGVPVGFPALTRAAKLGRRGARVGFDWSDAGGVRAQVAAELAELDEACAVTAQDSGAGHAAQTATAGAPSADAAAIAEELGDVLFSLAQLARHLHVDPEAALRAANDKFVRRFLWMERELAHRAEPGTDAAARVDSAEWERLWQAAKQAERA